MHSEPTLFFVPRLPFRSPSPIKKRMGNWDKFMLLKRIYKNVKEGRGGNRCYYDFDRCCINCGYTLYALATISYRRIWPSRWYDGEEDGGCVTFSGGGSGVSECGGGDGVGEGGCTWRRRGKRWRLLESSDNRILPLLDVVSFLILFCTFIFVCVCYHRKLYFAIQNQNVRNTFLVLHMYFASQKLYQRSDFSNSSSWRT